MISARTDAAESIQGSALAHSSVNRSSIPMPMVGGNEYGDIHDTM